MKRETLRRLNGHETFDEIRLKVVPRYKTSGMSGDEWRTSVRCELYFKGVVVGETSWSSMDAAVARLPGFVDDAACPVPEQYCVIEETKCHQPSCAEDAVAKYKVKRLTSEQGEYLAKSEYYWDYVRQFCRAHMRRGDCSREDCDDNYEIISGPEPMSFDDV